MPKKRIWSEEEINSMKKMYCVDGKTLTQIAPFFKTKPATISKLLKANGVTIKKQGTTRNRLLKEDYFESIDSEAKAYLLGFIFTDGSVFYRNRANSPGGVLSLEVNSKDLEIIEFLQNELNSNVSVFKRESKNTIGVKISSTKLVDSLAQYDIVPNKTIQTVKLPSNIPQEFYVHFLRGMFDGDGTLYLKTSTNKYVVGFTTYYRSMAEDFKNSINALIKRETPLKTVNSKTSWKIQWNKKEEVKKIVELLYGNATCGLSRKKEIADKIIAW